MRLDKWKIIRHVISLKREQWLDADKFRELQERRLAAIVEYAADTPYYRSLMERESIDPKALLSEFSSFQLTAKSDVLLHPEAFINPAAVRELAKFSTSGSTGRPLPVFMDRDALYYSGAVKYAMLTDFGLMPYDLYAEVNVWADRPRFERLGIFRRLRLPILDAEESNFAEIKKHGVNVIGTYPSVAEILAKINDSHGRPLKMKSLYLGGEVLDLSARETIGRSFSCPVMHKYGSMEFGFMAWDCPEEKNLHVSSSVLMEIVDARGRPAKKGEIVVSTMYNRAMPLLRYRLGDLGSWGDECPCGRGWPVLESLGGRTSDIVVLPSGASRPSFAFNVLYNMKSDVSSIRQFQIVQRDPGLFVFRYVPARGGPPLSCLEEIRQRMLRVCNEEVTIEFEETDSIARTPGGKLTHILPYRGSGSGR
jgi:phenylacetate-CoA ligase